MGLYVLIGRPNVDEERLYPILIYQSKNNMIRSEFQIKCTIEKLLYSKGDSQWWTWNCPKLPIILFWIVSQTHYLLLRIVFHLLNIRNKRSYIISVVIHCSVWIGSIDY